MGIPKGPVPKFGGGFALQKGDDLQKLASLQGDVATGITAKAGGTKAAAVPITQPNVQITVCATNGDSVILPPGYPGLEIKIANRGAANAQVFGANSDTINDVVTATGVAQNAGVNAIYKCLERTSAGVNKWYVF